MCASFNVQYTSSLFPVAESRYRQLLITLIIFDPNSHADGQLEMPSFTCLNRQFADSGILPTRGLPQIRNPQSAAAANWFQRMALPSDVYRETGPVPPPYRPGCRSRKRRGVLPSHGRDAKLAL